MFTRTYTLILFALSILFILVLVPAAYADAPLINSAEPPVFAREWYFVLPTGIAVDSSGNVYVTSMSNAVQKFDANGTFLLQWTSGVGGFNLPMGVAVDNSGNVYVADMVNNRIQKFDPNLNSWTSWGSAGSGEGQFSLPTGVAVDGSGSVYIVDWGNNRIQKFDSSGTFLDQWGSAGSGEGQFSSPYYIAVDGSGSVYVTDSGNNRIQKFDSSGTFLSQWGSYGSDEGQFNNPIGIAVDSGGNVYIVDQVNNRIQKFDSSGTFLGQWGNGGFYNPVGIAVDRSGNVYVADSLNYLVYKFSPVKTRAVTMSEDGAPTPFSLTLTAGDPEGDTLTWSIQTQAGHGAASADGTGTSKTIGYTPLANYSGSDSFSVKVADGTGGQDTLTVNVTIQPVNDAPVANAGSNQNVRVGSTVTLNGSASSDVENNLPLVYGWTQTGGPAVTLSSAGVVSPTFTMPAVSTVLTFTLTVTDSFGLADPTPAEVVVSTKTISYLPFIIKGGQ